MCSKRDCLNWGGLQLAYLFAMFKLCRLLSQCTFALFFATCFFVGSASANESNLQPVAHFSFMGERITLYPSYAPNIYQDQNKELWIPALNETKSGQGQYQYKKLSAASKAEIDNVKKLSPTSVANIYNDHRGEKWVRITNPTTQEITYVRLSEATTADMDSIQASKNNLAMIWWHQAKEFPNQAIKFSVAQFIVEMTACYGLNVLTFSHASHNSPACTTEFFRHIVEPKGLVGFYMFMVASGYTTETTMRIIETSHKLRGTGVPDSVLRAKFMPYLGYFGMVAGSLASMTTEHILSNKNWTACIAAIKDMGLMNEHCQAVVTSFATDEEFWRGFATGLPSLLLSSVAAHFAQQMIVKNYQSFASSEALRRMNVKMLQGSDEVIRLIARFGPKAVTGVKIVGAVVAGVPGAIIFVVTEVGQFVGFLQFDVWFRMIFNPAINNLIETNKTLEGVDKILQASDELQKNGWSKPVTAVTKCTRTRISRSEFKTDCEEEETIRAGLALLKTGATNYRKMVLTYKFDEANAKWSTKVSGFMNKYRVSKLLLEHIYSTRQASPQKTDLSLSMASLKLAQLWLDAIENEARTDQDNRHKDIFLNSILEMVVLAESLPMVENRTGALKSQDSFLDSILPDYLDGYFSTETPSRSSEDALLAAINKVRDEAGRYYSFETSGSLGSSPCLGTPRTCLALQMTYEIPFEKLSKINYMIDDTSSMSTAEYTSNLASAFGLEPVEEVISEMLCQEGQNKFVGHNTTDNGRAAQFHVPFMVQLSEAELDKFMRINCSDVNGNRKFHLDQNDLSRPWIMGDRVYSDAISLLMDQSLRLKLGATADEAQMAWQTQAFPIASEFLKNMSIAYYQMVDENFFPQVPRMTAQELIQRSMPRMRGAERTYHIVTVGQSKLKIPFTDFPVPISVGDKPLLSESLLGHVIFLMEQIKFKGPEFTGKHELCDEIIKKFAEHIVGLNHPIDTARLQELWSRYESDIKYAGSDYTGIESANSQFNLKLADITVGNEKLELIKKQRNEIYPLIDQLYEGLTNYSGALLDGMDEENYMLGTPLVEARKLSKQEYKKYIFYQLEYNTLNDILVEIRHIYDKLSMNAFTNIPDQSH